MVEIKFANDKVPAKGIVIVGCYESLKLTPEAQDLNKNNELSGILSAVKFTGKDSEIQVIPLAHAPEPLRVVVVGLGAKDKLNSLKLTKIGGALEVALSAHKIEDATLALHSLTEGDHAQDVLALVHGIQLKGWRFDKYRTKQSEDAKIHFKTLHVLSQNPADLDHKFASYSALIQGIDFARTLISEPANVIYPETLAQQARTLEKLGVEVEILDVPQMKKLGMHALLGVGQGSAQDSRLIVVKWLGHASKDKAPIAIAGKGVTFDTGGISIKPSSGMDAMKTDMSGSAVVLGLIKALALRKAPVNVVGVIGAVENMPSGTAQRPGDIVVSMSGQTIEVLDTDAEGRLVLADVLWYTQSTFHPQYIVDLATLTGAIQITFGSHHAGLFANDDKLADELYKAGQATGERVWRLPLGDEYDKEIDSDIADVKNLGASRSAGSIAAAQFLQRFVNKTPWAHLDIASVSWLSKDTPFARKGATAFGVRLLNQWLKDHYE